MDSAGARAMTRSWQRSEDIAPRPICTFFAMGGCNKGDRCPFSHELVQVAPKGVDASGGFYISGKVANYKAAASAQAASPSSRGSGARWEDPATSSSTDGLSTLASPSSCCMTTGTSLSAEAKEWNVADSAAVSSSANSATASTTSVQSQRMAATPTTHTSAGSARYPSIAVPRSAPHVSPPPACQSHHDSPPPPPTPPPRSDSSPLPKQSPPQEQKPASSVPHAQPQPQPQPQPPQPRSVAIAHSALNPNRITSATLVEARHAPPVSTPATSATSATPQRTVSFTQSSSCSGTGTSTVAALASFISMQRSTAAAAKPITLLQTNSLSLARHEGAAPAAAAAAAAVIPARYTASSTPVPSGAAALRSITSLSTPVSTAVAAFSNSTRSTSRAETPSQHAETTPPRSREMTVNGVAAPRSFSAKNVAAATASAGAPATPLQHESRVPSSAPTRVLPPAPRSQQQQQHLATQQQQHQQQQQLAQQQQQQQLAQQQQQQQLAQQQQQQQQLAQQQLAQIQQQLAQQQQQLAQQQQQQQQLAQQQAARQQAVQKQLAQQQAAHLLRVQQEAEQLRAQQEAQKIRAQQQQQQEAAQQQMRAHQEAQHQAQLKQQQQQQLQAAQHLQQLQQQIHLQHHQAQQQRQLQHQAQQQQQQQQQQTVYVVTTSRQAAPVTPPHERAGATVAAQLPFGYTLAYAVPAHAATGARGTPILLSESPATVTATATTVRPTYTLLSSGHAPSQLQSFQTTKGAVLYAAPAQVLPQPAAPTDGEAPRLILVKADGTLSLLQAANFASAAVPGRQPTLMRSH